MAGKLNPKQKAFAELYDGNATEAAKKAGYSPKTAYSQGERLLKNVEVMKLIRSREKKESRGNIASRQERQEFWSEVMNNGKEDMKDRLKASELLGKSECDFTENIQHSGEVNTVVVIKEGTANG